jgi:flagellar basal-body rod modification protein FlgD
VTADGAATALKDGRAAWKLNAPRAGTAVVTITDRTGNQVHSRELTLSAGDQDFVWDGRLENGQSAPAGEYRVTVAAKDGAGQVMVVKSEIAGIVDSVDVTGSDPILKIGEVTVPVSAVRSIRR